MKFLTTWAVLPGATRECVELFLAGEAAPEPGVTLIARWFKVDGSGGVAISETNDAALIFKSATKWADLMELSITPIIGDAEAGPIFAARFKK